MERDYPMLQQPSAGDYDDMDADSGLFPSLMELSMGGGDDSVSQGSREDLMTMCMESDEHGDFGLVLRHFTVLAAVPVSAQIYTCDVYTVYCATENTQLTINCKYLSVKGFVFF